MCTNFDHGQCVNLISKLHVSWFYFIPLVNDLIVSSPVSTMFCNFLVKVHRVWFVCFVASSYI